MPAEPLLPAAPERWAHFRFSVIGSLLAAPPAKGELQARIKELAGQSWRHPFSGQPFELGFSTIERWYYAARGQKRDPVQVLRRKIRCDRGQHPLWKPALIQALALQHQQHPNWSYQLHADNLAVTVEQQTELGPMPSYTSVLRYMKSNGLFKRPRRGPVGSPGAQRAEERFYNREIRSYESEYVGALWHLDFHHGSLPVLSPSGKWVYPILLAILDDCSRFCCHAQWYLAEGAEELCHGMPQAFQKRGMPCALMSDNGSAMVAGETQLGLARLGILHERTLPFSPFQNGKQESFWGQIEGRLLPMLELVADLALRQLNEATLAWTEMEYNRAYHSELKQSPLQVFLNTKDVSRPCPSSLELQQAFMAQASRKQRRSDGTLSLEGQRFEIPSRYGHLAELRLRYASWDLSHVYIEDPATGTILCRIYPLDKQKNAQGQRASREQPLPPSPPPPQPQAGSSGMAPLLQKIMRQYAVTGLPPAYLPKDEISTQNPS